MAGTIRSRSEMRVCAAFSDNLAELLHLNHEVHKLDMAGTKYERFS